MDLLPGLTNLKIKQLRIRTSGNGTFYPVDELGNSTPPVGKKWLIWSKYINNYDPANQASASYYELLSLNGLTYRVSATTSLTYNTMTSTIESMILDSGMSRGVVVSAGVVNMCINVYEFDATAPLKTVFMVSPIVGDNILYTVPAGKSALLLPVNTNPLLLNSTPQVAGFNTVTATVTWYYYFLRAGEVVGITNRFCQSANQSGVNKISATVYWAGSAGDSLVFNMSTATAFPWWCNVWEF